MAQDETFSGAFAVIRRSPRAVLGLSLLASLVNVIAGLAVVVLFGSEQFMRMLWDPTAFEDPEMAWAAVGDGGSWLLLILSTLLGSLLLALSVGLLAIPTMRSAYGLPTTLVQTIRLRAGAVGWLVLYFAMLGAALGILGAVVLLLAGLVIGVTLFIGAVAVLPGLFLLLCWVTAALMFGPVAIVVEGRGPISAVARSIRLNRGLWWRHIGTVALLYLIGGIAMLVATMPASLILGLGSEVAWQSPQGQEDWRAIAVLGLGQIYDAVLVALLVALAGTVFSMMYLNARFRQEALDAVLLDATDTAGPAGRLVPASAEHLSGYYWAERSTGAHV